jgi:PKHD-type hydroxylase
MNLEHYYYAYQSVLPERFCNQILDYGNRHKSSFAWTGEWNKKIKNGSMSDSDIKILEKKRRSNIVWLDDQWIYKEIAPIVRDANKKAGWNFDYDFAERIQFTKYESTMKGHYGWHCDSFKKPYENKDDPMSYGRIRKLSVTISLVDGSEYEGGNLEFDFKNNDPDNDSNTKKLCTEIRPKGSVVVFPSFVWHRVTPVTKGTRYSMVVWNLGYPYK